MNNKSRQLLSATREARKLSSQAVSFYLQRAKRVNYKAKPSAFVL